MFGDRDIYGNKLYRDKKGFLHHSYDSCDRANEKIEKELALQAEHRRKILAHMAKQYGYLGRLLLLCGGFLAFFGLLIAWMLYSAKSGRNSDVYELLAVVSFVMCFAGFYIASIGVSRAERWKALDAAYCAFFDKVRLVISIFFVTLIAIFVLANILRDLV